MSQAKVIDLFCGAGGLTYGLQEAGLEVIEGVDVDEACRYPFESNTGVPFVSKDVRKYTPEDAEAAWGDCDIRIMVGCAPCQPFSTYTQGPRGNHKQKWVLLKKFASLVEETEPDIVSMENVTPLQETDTFRRFVRRLKKAEYDVSHQIVDCRHYGAPQMRRRLVLLASRLGSIDLIPKTHEAPESWTSVGSIIGHLPVLPAGGVHSDDPLPSGSATSSPSPCLS